MSASRALVLCSIFQRYKLKAIHNRESLILIPIIVVLNISKIQTESNSQLSKCNLTSVFVVLNISKIQTESNSQPKGRQGSQARWLCSIFQRYKLKAIHNGDTAVLARQTVVLNISKIQTESNSQHTGGSLFFLLVVLNISKIQTESNSQHACSHTFILSCCAQYFKDTNWKQFTTVGDILPGAWRLCSIFQRYKLKAIHNVKLRTNFLKMVVLNISKIQTESNSQRSYIIGDPIGGCAQYFKDTNWKQFTTAALPIIFNLPLCSIFQRYKLKAIHNGCWWCAAPSEVVLNISKIQTESNSQHIRFS